MKTDQMSRRKQSNPKPLKRDDPWFEDDEESDVVNMELDKCDDDLDVSQNSPNTEPQVSQNEDSGGKAHSKSSCSVPEHVHEKLCNGEVSPGSLVKVEIIEGNQPASQVIPSSPGPSSDSLAPTPVPFFPFISAHAITPDGPTLMYVPVLQNGQGLPSSDEAKTKEISEAVANHSQLMFVCEPCGIKFSSRSTLDAHQLYYCSHRDKSQLPSESKVSAEGESQLADRQPSENQTARVASAEPTATSSTDTEVTPSNAKSVRSGRTYYCPHCSYRADKKVSVNRHMRIHNCSPDVRVTTPDSNDLQSDSVASRPSNAAFCHECNIQFTSSRTLFVHKQFYCFSRRLAKTVRDRPDSEYTETMPPDPRIPQPYFALSTHPVIVVPCSIIQNATLLPQGMLPQEGLMVALDGTLQQISSPFPRDDTPNHVDISGKKTDESASPPAKRKVPAKVKEGLEGPLDLRCRSANIHPKQSDKYSEDHILGSGSTSILDNISVSSRIAPQTSHKTPSISPSVNKSPSQESSRGSVQPISSPRSINASPSVPVPELKHIFEPSLIPFGFLSHASRPSVLFPSPGPMMQPELTLRMLSPDSFVHINKALTPTTCYPNKVVMKKGASRCKECNIVFTKQDNYAVHKKMYCSARESLESEEKEGTLSKSPVVNENGDKQKEEDLKVSNSPEDKPSPSIQFICTKCGIKFLSPDNLRAHQMYYCHSKLEGKLSDIVTPVVTPKTMWKCPKCKITIPSEQRCLHECKLGGETSGWKCPECEYTSPTAVGAQKHVESHCVQAFRCTVCGYRGNTLRGMRTHIRMHFEKRPADLQEERYIVCIKSEEDSRPPCKSNVLADIHEEGTMNGEHSLEPLVLSKTYNCDICKYSSPYKGNVVRHYKLLHSKPMPSTLSPQLDIKREAGDERDRVVLSPIKIKVEVDSPAKMEIDSAESCSHNNNIVTQTRSPSSLCYFGKCSGLRGSCGNQCQSCNSSSSYISTIMGTGYYPTSLNSESSETSVQ